MIDVAIATCAEFPQLPESEQLLQRALEQKGLSVRAVLWDDPSFEWSEVRLCLIRSVWDYHLRLDEFLGWVDRLPASVRVFNPPEVIRWNSHKGYLRDLETRGIPIVPTAYFSPGDAPDIRSVAAEKGWTSVVVKPVVSANGHRTAVFDDLDIAEKHLEELLRDGGAMVQRFMDEVHGSGERCICVIDGRISHALQKTTVFDPEWTDTPPRVDVSEEESELAFAALEASGFSYLYARVDMIRDEDGSPRLMELEMIEPDFYFDRAPEAADTFADRIIELLG